MLRFWTSLYEELVHGWGWFHLSAPLWDRRGRYFWNAAACFFASWNRSTTEFTAPPNRPDGETGAFSRNALSLSFIWDRVNQKCLSVTNSAAIDRPIALAVSLVARSNKSVALSISAISSDFIVSSSSKYPNNSAWYACSTAMVCKQPAAWPAAVYALHTKAKVVIRGLVDNTGAFREDSPLGER